MKDTVNQFMAVPCGHCPDCIAAKQSALVQRAEVESKSHHVFFATLTYDNKHLPYAEIKVPCQKAHDQSRPGPLFDAAAFLQERESFTSTADDFEIESLLEDALDDCLSNFQTVALDDITPDDVDEGQYETIRMPYADIHHIQLLMKNIRDNNPVDGREIKYICVSELGKTNGRPHFHVLLFVEHRPADFNGDGTIKAHVMYDLEQKLWRAFFKYWAINIGTRKNPVYERLFTYRKRFLGSRVYTNFDLHWVNPGRFHSSDKPCPDKNSVVYYVTKYMMKQSDKEQRRQQFLALHLTEDDYREFWNTIKCRVTISKGLGLNARFYTIDKTIETYAPLCQYADFLASVQEDDDLPPDDVSWQSQKIVTTVKRRIMVPDFETAQWIRGNLTNKVGEEIGPVYKADDGTHKPLAHYYQRFSYIFTDKDAITIWLNAPADKINEDFARKNMSKERKDELFQKLKTQRETVERNSTFDTSPALLWGSEADDNNNPRMALFGL